MGLAGVGVHCVEGHGVSEGARGQSGGEATWAGRAKSMDDLMLWTGKEEEGRGGAG